MILNNFVKFALNIYKICQVCFFSFFPFRMLVLSLARPIIGCTILIYWRPSLWLIHTTHVKKMCKNTHTNTHTHTHIQTHSHTNALRPHPHTKKKSHKTNPFYIHTHTSIRLSRISLRTVQWNSMLMFKATHGHPYNEWQPNC